MKEINFAIREFENGVYTVVVNDVRLGYTKSFNAAIEYLRSFLLDVNENILNRIETNIPDNKFFTFDKP